MYSQVTTQQNNNSNFNFGRPDDSAYLVSMAVFGADDSSHDSLCKNSMEKPENNKLIDQQCSQP